MKNITIKLENNVAHWSRVWATEHNTSVSRILGDLLKRMKKGKTGYAQAMHPQDATKTITYALDSGRIISLSDIFRPDSGYLNIISNDCIKNLMQRSQVRELSNREWVEKGAAAKAENFTNWNVARDGLLITFEEYQVAPYASGSFEVTIPYSRLASVIRKDGILKDVLKQHQK